MVWCCVSGRLPPVPGRVRDRQRPQGGGRELAGRVQGRLRHRHDRAAAHAPHPPRPRAQLLSEYTLVQETLDPPIYGSPLVNVIVQPILKKHFSKIKNKNKLVEFSKII